VGVDHHGQVDVVELAARDEFGLAAQELQFALVHKAVAVLNLHVLLGGYGKEHD